MQTYKHSGTVPVSGGISTAVAGLSAAVIGGFAYGFAFYWMPFTLLKLLLLMGYCFLVGTTIAGVARSTKIRSPLFVTAIAVICVIVGWWVEWGAYRWAKEGAGIGLAAWSPTEILAFGQRLFEDGSFRLRRSTVAGWFLVGFWIAEAGTMLVSIVRLAREDAARPFCEACEAWTDTDKGLIHLASDGKEPAWAQVLAGDLASLGLFPVAAPETSPYARLDLTTCPKCEHSNYLSITATTITLDKKGNAKEKHEPLMTNAVLTATQAEMVRQLANLLESEGQQDYAEGEVNDEDLNDAGPRDESASV
jgi:hypothetical protein